MRTTVTALSKTTMPKGLPHPRAVKRRLLLLGAISCAATVAVAQSPAPADSAIADRRAVPFPLTHPLQEMPDTFYRNGIRYITLRPGMPWKQPVNDGKTFYLMQAVPQPRRDKAAPVHEAPNTPPLEPNEP